MTTIFIYFYFFLHVTSSRCPHATWTSPCPLLIELDSQLFMTIKFVWFKREASLVGYHKGGMRCAKRLWFDSLWKLKRRSKDTTLINSSTSLCIISEDPPKLFLPSISILNIVKFESPSWADRERNYWFQHYMFNHNPLNLRASNS